MGIDRSRIGQGRGNGHRSGNLHDIYRSDKSNPHHTEDNIQDRHPDHHQHRSAGDKDQRVNDRLERLFRQGCCF